MNRSLQNGCVARSFKVKRDEQMWDTAVLSARFITSGFTETVQSL